MQTAVGIAPTHSFPGGFWDASLEVVFGLIAVAGAVFVLGPDFPALGWLNRAVVAAFFPGGVPEGANALRHWLYAVEGATLVAFGVLGLAVVRVPFRRREEWARNGLALAIGTWFILDTTASAVHGVWANVALNVGIAAALLVPIAGSWRRFATRDGSDSLEPRIRDALRESDVRQ